MPANTRQMNFGVFVHTTGNHISGWRFPGAITRDEDFPAIHNVAMVAEKAKLDFVFFADTPTSMNDGLPVHLVRFEPATLLSALAVTTSRIGLVATLSTTYNEPFNLARQTASIDQLCQGRAGWNAVTTANMEAAPNYGRAIIEHDKRYEIAAEYLEVILGLWDSWEDGAIIANQETGEYFEPKKVHTLDHKGEFYQVKGPLPHSRSRQGRPVIVQAGSSPAGQAFASRYADVVFTVQQDMEEARKFREGIKRQVAAAGRSPDEVKVMPGILTVVGRTEEEAKAQFAALAASIKPGSAMKVMSERYGHDLSTYPMDGPVPELPPSPLRTQGYAEVMLAKARRENWTLKDLHDLFALSRGYLMVVGTGESVADTLEEWFKVGACDGFMLTPAYFPGPLEDFCNLAIPVLRKRGLFREDYAGDTLRSHLGLPVPKNRYTA